METVVPSINTTWIELVLNVAAVYTGIFLFIMVVAAYFWIRASEPPTKAPSNVIQTLGTITMSSLILALTHLVVVVFAALAMKGAGL